MASNQCGTYLKMTTWGESHGPAIGVVLDGCPAGIPLCEADLHAELVRRRPGGSVYTSPRQEADEAQILSGIWEGVTTGTPISILIPNRDVRPEAYAPMKHLLRPGHATFAYAQKYGVVDSRGGGRSSARETACRVAAGAVAKKILARAEIQVLAFLSQVGDRRAAVSEWASQDIASLRPYTTPENLFCPHAETRVDIQRNLETVMHEGDSLGGCVQFRIEGVPPGLGDPVYEKLEANLAKAMMGLPASKAFGIGSGFRASQYQGSVHNDVYLSNFSTASNHAGGTSGGISTGMPIEGEVHFKPTSSIAKTQPTVSLTGELCELRLPAGSRHDPCVAIRAVPVVEAMAAWVIADAWLIQRCTRW